MNPNVLGLWKFEAPCLDKWAPSREVIVTVCAVGTLNSSADAIATWLRKNTFETVEPFQEACSLSWLGTTPDDDVRKYVPLGKVVAVAVDERS